uniref:Uncharacterized protein n=1 Tax=Amphimedon queenslandica TaxID=400682 RepID=A0A1X7SJC8_AMPQE
MASLFPFLKNDLMGHGPAHRLLEQNASTNTEIHTDNWIDRTSDLMMMMKMKKGG